MTRNPWHHGCLADGVDWYGIEYEWDRILYRAVAVARQTILPWEKAVQERLRTADVLVPTNDRLPQRARVRPVIPVEPQDVPLDVGSDSEMEDVAADMLQEARAVERSLREAGGSMRDTSGVEPTVEPTVPADVSPQATMGSRSSASSAGVYPQAPPGPADVSPQVSAAVAEVPPQTPPSDQEPKAKAVSRIARLFDNYDEAMTYAQAHQDPDAAAAAGFLRGVNLDAHPRPHGPPAKVSAKVPLPKAPPPNIRMETPKPKPPPVPKRPVVPPKSVIGGGGIAPPLARPPVAVPEMPPPTTPAFDVFTQVVEILDDDDRAVPVTASAV